MHGSTGPVLDSVLLTLSQNTFRPGNRCYDTINNSRIKSRKMHSSVLRYFESQSYKNTKEGERT